MKYRNLAFSIAALVVSLPTAFAADRDVALVVDGLDCAACPIMVRKSLERLDGVKVARLDVDASTMHLIVSNDAVSDADLVQAAAYEGTTGASTMKIADAAVLITGANRGLGRALVEDVLRRGAKRVYAGTRQPFAHSDGRVTAVTLDVRNAAQICEAAAQVVSLDLLINNAAVAQYDDLGDRAMLERHLAVNVFGLYDVTQAFLPLLTRSQGAIVNVISDSALTPVPFVPAYSMSKAAAFSLTQSMRALWAAQGVSVHAAMAGPIDTDMSRDADIPKSTAETVARGILDGVERAEADIFPDPVSSALARSWRTLATDVLEMRRSWQKN